MLRIHLFGHPRLEWDGRPYKLDGPPRAFGMLAYLLLNRGAAVSRDALAFDLWPDDDEEHARANVRRHLHRLQHAMPATAHPWLATWPDAIAWNDASPVWCDVAEFEAALQNERLDDARALYAGELLQGSYDEWLLPIRERLRARYVDALERLISDARSRRDFQTALRYVAELLAADSWREDALRTLMSIRYSMGDRSGALRAADEFARRLAAEMQTDLMPETIALRETIARHLPLPESPAALDASTDKRRTLLPFVGRDAERERLAHLWNISARGRGQTVLMGGESGIGKTRLANEFALLAQRQGARVFTGSTSSPESRAYQAICEALLAAAPLLTGELDPQWLAVLAQAMPQLRARRGDLPEPVALEGERERTRLLEAFGVAIAALSRARPALLILEDVHWAGAATLRAFEFLAHRCAEQTVMILATYRDTAQTPALREVRNSLRESSRSSEFALGPLSCEAVIELVVKHRKATAQVGEGAQLYQMTGGLPLLIDALTGVDTSQDTSAPALARLDAIVAERLRAVPEDARDLAQTAAIAGDGFSVELLHEVTGWSESAVLDAVGALQDQRLVRERRGSFDFVFSHDMIRAAVYEAVPQEVRRRRHRRVARVRERFAADDRYARDIAQHYERAGENELAATHYMKAAAAAVAVYAPQEAFDAASRGLTLTASVPLRARLLLIHEGATASLGLRQARGQDLRELSALAAGDAELSFTVAQRKVDFGERIADLRFWSNALEDLAKSVKPFADDSHRAQLLMKRAAYDTFVGRYESAKSGLLRALDLLARPEDVGAAMDCHCALLQLAGRCDDAAEAARRTESAQSAAEEMPAHLRARMLSAIASAAYACQMYERTYEVRKQSVALYRESHDRGGEAFAWELLGATAAVLWRFAEAEECLERADALAREMGDEFAQVISSETRAGLVYLPLGAFEEAFAELQSVDRVFHKLGHARMALVTAVNLSEAAHAVGARELARCAAQKALGLARASHHRLMVCRACTRLGIAEIALGRVAAGRRALRQAVALARSLALPAELADVLHEFARACWLSGERDAARTAIEEGVALGAPLDAIHHAESVLWTGACVARAFGERERAQVLLERARELVLSRSAEIPRERWRTAYLAMPCNRAILGSLAGLI